MLAIHPNARTTPAVRAEIARSSERSGVLAERYGISTETVRKWRRRGPAGGSTAQMPSAPAGLGVGGVDGHGGVAGPARSTDG